MWINDVTMVTPMLRFPSSVRLLKVSQERGVILYIGLQTILTVRVGGTSQSRAVQSSFTWSPIKSY